MPMSTGDLIEIEQIRQLKARYFRSIDRKLFADVSDLFTQDAAFDLEGIVEREPTSGVVITPGLDAFFSGRERAVIRGHENIAHFIRTMLEPVISIHHGFTPEIEITGPGLAKGTWPMEDMFFDPAPPHRKMRHGHGHYRETYRKEGERWRISSSTLDFAHEERFD